MLVEASSRRQHARAPGSGMDQPAAAERPVFPQRFLEDHHHVLGIQARGLRETRHHVAEDLLLHFDAATHRKQDLDQYEILREIGRDTSELQSQSNLVCRLLLEKKKKKKI